MRIKQLELNGFKSFMERTVLELPQGLTAIVGPNGCGKSNIVDAIRWVIGEQSPKHLRGDAMEDVVCNGSADVGPLGMAEVSLLMTRDEAELARAETAGDTEAEGVDALPPELARASELLVTRRYFRSGESEYFINRVPCRLKDITELFLGTGVGTKAYAIIEQGRIDQIVNAKPEDLRLFIEEAAGVTRFRNRKIAAERKMSRTRDNLVRVQDVLRELERQKTILERQARRAEEYHRIRGELRDVDVRVMRRRYARWIAEMAESEAAIAVVLDEEARLQEDIRRHLESTGESRTRRLADEEALHDVDDELGEQRARAREAEAHANALATRQADLLQRAGVARQEADTLRARLEGERATLAVLEAAAVDLATAEGETRGAYEEAEGRLRQLATAGGPLEQGLEEGKAAVLACLTDESRLRNMAEALRQRHDEIQGRRRKLEAGQRQLGERLHANDEATIVARADIARIEGDRAELTEQRSALVARQQELAREELTSAGVLESIRTRLTGLRSRAQSLRELQARHEGCTRGAASLLGRGGDQAMLLASVLRVPAELERAVAAALGARLTNVVVADGVAAVEGVRWLATTAGGSATVVPREATRRPPAIVPAGRRLLDAIEVDPQHWSLAEALLGHVLLADGLDMAVDLWRGAQHAVAVVTPEGEAVDVLGAVSGGSEPPLEETILARARELRELGDAVERAEREDASAMAALSLVRGRLEEVAGSLAQVEERLQALRLDALAQQKDVERLEEERARLSAELEVWAMEAGGLAGADGETAVEIAAVAQRLAEAATRLAERRAELSARQEALARWREAHTEAEEARTAAAVAATSATERRRAGEVAIGRAREVCADVDGRAGEAEQEALRLGERATLAALERDEALALQRASEERIGEVEACRDRLRAAIAAAEAALEADDAVVREARASGEACRERRSGLEIVLAERRMSVEHLTDQLLERYGLTPEAFADAPEEADVAPEEEAAARVEKLRARLQQIGDVNPGAATELAELTERYGFLVGQRDDLERSLEDLRRTISKLTRTSRERFEETFAGTNEKLAEVFPKLFPGGKAQLELTTPEEGEEAGVHIVVQPVGKKLQHMSLLSGGEKALTATALVLALFLIRPTPFCLLDEVDAPLDEANIGRFNQVIREMAETCQFMLITHNRRTMEAADTLYGITMEQPGVSKVVSVRLREAA